MLLFFLLVTAFFSVFLLTYSIRCYALTHSIIDVPNARSSHSVPTPRGGGVAIVLSFLIGVTLLSATNLLAWDFSAALLGAGAGVAILGFLDDHGHIAARWRLLGHFAAALWALLWLGGLPAIEIAGVAVNFGWAGYILAVFYLVWMLNLYNFMDGIDGIASVEAICSCLGACLLYWFAGFDSLIILPLTLAAAVAGFLYWNFPPARIFMGDAGSGFLGVVLGILSLQAAWTASSLLWAWLILLGVFIVDATFTLFRRLLRGDRVYEAHRSHAYQFASRCLGGHLPVTMIVAAINVLWLFPIAACVVLMDLDGFLGLILAYLPLLALAIRFKAGSKEHANSQGDHRSG